MSYRCGACNKWFDKTEHDCEAAEVPAPATPAQNDAAAKGADQQAAQNTPEAPKA